MLLRGALLSSVLAFATPTVANLPTEPGDGTGTVTINRVHEIANGAAPYGVVATFSVSGFTATGPSGGEIYDDRLHDIYYFVDWDWTNTGNSAIFTAPTRVWDGSVKHTSGHKNDRYSYGPAVAHVYRQSGAPTMRVFCYEPNSGISAEAFYTFSIGDEDAAYPNLQTIYLDPNGVFAGAPSGCRQLTSSDIASALNTYVVGQEGTPYRIILADDVTSFTIGQYTFGNASDTPQVFFKRSGAGTNKPEITGAIRFFWKDTQTANSGPGSNKDLILQGLKLTGNGPGGSDFLVANEDNAPNMFLMDQIEVDQMAHFGFSNKGAWPNVDHRCYLWNDSIWREYGSWGMLNEYGGTHVWNGHLFATPVTALVDDPGNAGATIRWQGGGGTDGILVMHSCDGFQRKGNNTSPPTSQPLVRNNANTGHGALYNYQCNVIEGGTECIQWETPAHVNIVMDKNEFVAVNNANAPISSHAGGISARNNRFRNPDYAGHYSVLDGINEFIDLNGGGSTENRDAPIKFLFNTFINRDSTTPGYRVPLFDNGSGTPFNAVTFANNVEHQPDLTTPGTADDDAPLKDDTNQFSPLDPGYQTSTIDERTNTVTQTTAGLFDTYEPKTTSNAIDDYTTGEIPADDFTGRYREIIRSDAGLSRTVPCRGATEVALES